MKTSDPSLVSGSCWVRPCVQGTTGTASACSKGRVVSAIWEAKVEGIRVNRFTHQCKTFLLAGLRKPIKNTPSWASSLEPSRQTGRIVEM